MDSVYRIFAGVVRGAKAMDSAYKIVAGSVAFLVIFLGYIFFIDRPLPGLRAAKALSVSSVVLEPGWRITQFLPSPNLCAAPNYYAVFAPEQLPRLHAFHVPECSIEYQYSEQGTGSVEERKPGPTNFRPALHKSAGFFLLAQTRKPRT